MKNINDLRQMLFEASASLGKNPTDADLAKAKAIAEIGQVIINSVKAETDYMRVTNQTAGSGFIAPAGGDALAAIGSPVSVITPPERPGLADQLAGANVRTHRMRG